MLKPRLAIGLTSLLILSALAGACTTGPAQPTSIDELHGTLTVSGAWALYPLMVRWAEVFQQEHPSVLIDVSAGGAGKGMADALAGAADLGMVSREVYPEEQSKGALAFPVAKDAVFVTVNRANPVLQKLIESGFSKNVLSQIYITGETTVWGQTVGMPENDDPIHIYTRSDAAGAPAVFAEYLGYAQEDLLGVGVYGDPGLAAAVAQDPLGIGYNNLNFAFDPVSGEPIAGIEVVPLDGNGNDFIDPTEIVENKVQAVQAVASGAYPAPPARDLYLVTHDKPAGLAHEFLLWIMTDGQQYVDEVGYIPVANEKLNQAIDMLTEHE